jgi:Spy/CpxP family protein refolding chaperone
MSDAIPAQPRRRSVLLIVSLCLNVILIPVIAVVMYHAAHRGNEIGSGGALSPRSVISAVPGERDRIETIITTHTPKVRALRAASAHARREAFATLLAPDYTAEKFRAALDAVANADSALERENIAMMAESLATLTAQERETMVSRTKMRNRFWLRRLFQTRPPRE